MSLVRRPPLLLKSRLMPAHEFFAAPAEHFLRIGYERVLCMDVRVVKAVQRVVDVKNHSPDHFSTAVSVLSAGRLFYARSFEKGPESAFRRSRTFPFHSTRRFLPVKRSRRCIRGQSRRPASFRAASISLSDITFLRGIRVGPWMPSNVLANGRANKTTS